MARLILQCRSRYDACKFYHRKNQPIKMHKMLQWAKDLYPICRSIMGQGTRDTLAYLKNIHPDLKTLVFKTGEKVFDWEIPKEWNIKDAYLEHESGRKFAEFKKHNLHVLNYSVPIDQIMDLSELIPHISTQPDQPDWIPYVTSYYKERWGFCMSEHEKNQMPPGKYKAYIDSSLTPGELHIGEIYLPGKTQQEIFFSTYICHPSMANNELSGPVLTAALVNYIKQNHPSPYYSYRAVFLPETIGSIAYLSRNIKTLKENMTAGFVLSCVGDNRAYSHVESRLGNTLADQALSAALIGKDNTHVYDFLTRGSDERQYCSPGVDLPVCGFCRSKYAEYPEYHTSADNFDVVTEEGLAGAFTVMKDIIDAFELGCLYPQNQILCEPQLGKRNLYPTLSQKGNSNKTLQIRMDVLAYADGEHSLFDIARRIKSPLTDITREIKILREHGLLI